MVGGFKERRPLHEIFMRTQQDGYIRSSAARTSEREWWRIKTTILHNSDGIHSRVERPPTGVRSALKKML